MFANDTFGPESHISDDEDDSEHGQDYSSDAGMILLGTISNLNFM